VRFIPTAITGAYFVELDVYEDERGLFARTFCERAFAQADIEMRIVQANISRNPKAGTLRGMHYQLPPHEEPKLIQCVRGRIFDAAIDLRCRGPSYRLSVCAELSAEDSRLLFIPPGCAHGFLTLEDNSDVFYYLGAAFDAGAARGLRWNDPAFEIPWPQAPSLISARDATYGDYTPRSEEDV
jgi:dTDP-4-dehydrorhamnose 3,5-epimerase